MEKILDLHTHHLTPNGIYDASDLVFTPELTLPDNQPYSVGIHPWHTAEHVTPEQWQQLEDLLQRPDCVAVGEAGIDLSGKGGLMFLQLQVFRRMVDYSESLKKPLIIHCVKGEDIIIGLRRDLKVKMPWVIHGFRKKPQVAEQLLRAGCMLSFGLQFNADTVRTVPADKLFVETDTATCDIKTVIDAVSAARGSDLTPIVAANIQALLSDRT